ncbi:type VI secretion system baseplate subunit TssK [Mangrovicoccus algicola]|uniref:Type VI secretion system baseplate subunit TssK n=1 Tax=Mangrovicoccus algicola TaxID=2771008 RepID=A0A8J7CY37_9RHOB|nr:type VI secretion system baseplate subunit TssK [Mangrovicoccus algicola]MBE3640694.1 type VI secretion system baseplate subunit TssK [Mangrovicoccus algicola]
MSWDSRVLWTEGLFLQPQHFQQQDRHVAALVAGLAARVAPAAWGVSTLEIDREALKIGQVALRSCSGLTPDGSLFRIPDAEDHPPALEVPPQVRDCVVFLTVPARRQGAAEVDLTGAELSPARLRPAEQEVVDTMGSARGPATLGIGKLRLQFALETDDLSDRIRIPVARIIETRPDGEVILDGGFIPAVMDCRASQVLSSLLTELEGLLAHRMTALSARLGQSGTVRATAEIQDFLLLQVINRALPVIRHFAQMEMLHPERLFAFLAALAGELASFMAQDRQAPRLPAYQHHALTGCFAPLVRALRGYLSAVLEANAVSIPLDPRKYGISVGLIADRKLIGQAGFVLSVAADLAEETLRRHFAGHAKIGPVEEIRTLVNSALPGIELQPLPVVPRQIPYEAGRVYFQLDGASPWWGKMTTSGGVAVHVSGEYPGLRMELWAIREG